MKTISSNQIFILLAFVVMSVGLLGCWQNCDMYTQITCTPAGTIQLSIDGGESQSVSFGFNNNVYMIDDTLVLTAQNTDFELRLESIITDQIGVIRSVEYRDSAQFGFVNRPDTVYSFELSTLVNTEQCDFTTHEIDVERQHRSRTYHLPDTLVGIIECRVESFLGEEKTVILEIDYFSTIVARPMTEC